MEPWLWCAKRTIWTFLALSQPEWNQSAVYNGGDRVAYKGRVYRAKWWTQGEIPDMADVWEDTLEAVPDSQSTTLPDPLPPAKPVPKPEGFKVVGYFPSWKPAKTDLPRYDVLTHIIYAFAIPTSEGGLRPLENPETARTILRDAHVNGVKVLLAVGDGATTMCRWSPPLYPPPNHRRSGLPLWRPSSPCATPMALTA